MHALLPAVLIGATSLALVACSSFQCAKAPYCEENETEVEDCGGQADCREVEACGETIGCVPAANCAAYPTCQTGYREVEDCPAGVTCQSESLCGATITCAPEGCATTSDCLAEEYCDFSDGQCGAGVSGLCKTGPTFCSDGPEVCWCDGSTSGQVGLPCEGYGGLDLDETGGCTLPPAQFSCGSRVCDVGVHFCRLVTDDTGGPDYPDCGSLPLGCSDCGCLTTETAACGGTCVDGAQPTITCPGG